MRCNPDQIVCALNQLGEVLREASQPGYLDVVAGVVVPLILGTATVILAIFTIKAARRSNQLAVELEDRREAREARSRRLAAVPDLIEWATLELLIGRDKDDIHESLRDSRNCVTDLKRTTGEPLLDSLRDWTVARVNDYHASDDANLAEAYGRIIKMIEEWADDPTALDRRVKSDVRIAALEKLIRKMGSETPLA